MPKENLSPACSKCGKKATIIKLVHGTKDVRFYYKGICGGNNGDPISDEYVDAIREAFTAPHTIERIERANLYDDGGFCRECLKFYCFRHWSVSTTGGGWCPEGHFKSLDPHWSPDD